MMFSVLKVALIFTILSQVESLQSNNYDHFTYTQQWPQGVCECMEGSRGLASSESCRIPEGVKTWTVHGLWPTYKETETPSYCNHSWPFEEHQILDIENKMKVFWPNLIVSSLKLSNSLLSKAIAVSGSRISFWEHEWVKHGTCCTDLSILNSEHKYFATGLDLNLKFDLLSWFHEKGIVPSTTKTYKLPDMRNVILSNVKARPYFHCCKSNNKQRVQEIMICLDKQLKPIDCVRGDEDCSDDLPVSYEPIVPY